MENELTVEQMQLQQIEALKSKMDTMVDPEKFKELKAQYESLLNDYVNKRTRNEVTQELKSAKEYAEILASGKTLSNRTYIETSVNYRDAFMKETGRDPWSDNGVETAETKQVAETFKQLLINSEGDSDFRLRLNNIMKDDTQLLAKIKRK